MIRTAVVLILISVANLPGQPVPAHKPTAFTHVTVIDGRGTPAQPDMTLVTEDQRIVSLGKYGTVAIPPNAQVIEAKDKFVIPGLWDMHVHLSWTKASALPALVANGVTGVRDLGGLLRELDEWRVRIESGLLIGPRIVRSGPVLNGRQFAFHQFAVTNQSEARGAVRALHKAGVDFVKVHRAISREAYFGAVDECKKLGLPLVGHIPNTVMPIEASQAGQASLEHVATLFDGTFATEHRAEPFAAAVERFTRESAAGLFAQFASNHTAFTPTLVSHRMTAQFGRSKPNVRDKYVSRSAQKTAADILARDKDQLTSAYYERMEQQFQAALPLVNLMQQAGVLMLAGTDLATAGTYPGFDLHDELTLMVQAGLTPMQALQSATHNAAAFLKLADAGTIAKGNTADLVLLDANPLEDIRNTQQIRAVILRGRFLDRNALDGLLRDAEQAAKAE
jgi:imidazolonepropionase-like amidohydrolase